MELSIGSRFKRAWNAFAGNDEILAYRDIGSGYSYRPDRPRINRQSAKTITTSIYTKIAIDVAAVDIRHVNLDDEGRFTSYVDSELNRCLELESNIDQTPRSLIQDAVMSMFDEGCVAIVPIDTIEGKKKECKIPSSYGSYDISSLRVGQVIEWYPKHVKLRVYNELTGRKEDIVLEKSIVAIIENPLYSIINEPNSTMQRLVRKLNLLDAIDEQSGSGKLDLIIQLPYLIKTDARREQAEKRRKDVESQLANNKYGIAYTDGAERITQLNRPVNNNLMTQIEYLTSMLYSQLGITSSIMDGTADDKVMLNYQKRTVEPIISAIVDEMKRKFLTREAISESQSIVFFDDPFRLVTVNSIAEIADKFTRNEIMSSNEIRQIIGRKPSNDPRADELRNKNLSRAKEDIIYQKESEENKEKSEDEK